MTLNCVYTDESFLPSMGIRLLAGRGFGTRRDTLAEREIIVNARAVRGLGFSGPGEAIGKKLYLGDSSVLEIIGVTDDFKYENAGKLVDPIAFRQRPEVCQYLYIAMKGADKKAFAQRVTAALQPLGPGAALTSSWLDETLAQNNSQQATISLLGYLAFIALGIATLGLLGLVIYTVETRRKETGIRKVIGASSGQIVAILSKRFIRLIVISGIIAVPIGYTMNYLFLQNFVERVGNGLISALGCFVFLLGVGLLTIFSQTWKAAQENPVNSLRTE
jgi:putative ABC transport system permease protein